MSNTACSKQNLNVKHVVTLFEEVQNRYVNKLLSIDERHITVDERHKQKLIIYESYVKDLSIQTRLLLQSLEELEKEANQRVGLLENKLKKVQTSSQSPSDLSKTPTVHFEDEKWKLSHENLDLKHDLDSLVTFINTAKRTGKWDTKRLQLKSLPLDRIIGMTNEENSNGISSNKEIQYRDERIQVMQAEIEHLRKKQAEFAKQTSTEEMKGQNLVLSKKVEDLRTKLSEECQKSETFKMDIRLKTTQIKDLQQELNEKKVKYEEHIHDLSSKLKTISDRHRESTTIINNDIKLKKQQIEQLTQQVEQVITEKKSYENERIELQRQCRLKDSINTDLDEQIRHLHRELADKSIPIEPSVPRIEYEKLDQEHQLLRKRLDGLTVEIKFKESLNDKLEQDLRLLKKIHDEQFEQHIQSTAVNVDQFQSEIRALKRVCDDKTDEFHRQSLELRSCQDQLAVERNKLISSEHEQQKLRQQLENSIGESEKLHGELKESLSQIDQFEQTIGELNSRNHLLESKLIETMTLIDHRNKTLLEYEEQLGKIRNECTQKHQDLLEKQIQIDQLEQNLIDKTAEAAQLSETLETDQVKNQHREKYAEDNATKALSDIKTLQRELRHVSESLAEREHANILLTEQIQKLTNDFQLKQDEWQRTQKSLNKQLTNKQDQLVRYDHNLHEAEIKCKYAREECLIQEKEIIRLNTVQEDQENKILNLQQDLLKLQEQRDAIAIQYERTEADLRNTKILREEETRKYTEEFEQLNGEISSLKATEVALLQNIDELKENLVIISNERDEFRDQNDNDQNEIENLQKMLCEETETGSKSASKVILLSRQLDEEQRRANDSTNQLTDVQMQFQGLLITSDTLKSELNQARLLLQEQTIKETDYKQNIHRIHTQLDDREKLLSDLQHEIETLNQSLTHLQMDYEKSKNDLSIARDELLQVDIGNQSIKQHLADKSNELVIVSNRLHQLQQDLHAYEKTHRYSNEEFFEREQRLKHLENELTTFGHTYEKLKREYQDVNEELERCRDDLDQVEKSDIVHKERLIQSIDEGKIYKQKLALLGDCFGTVVRKASETSDGWANIAAHLDEQIVDLVDDADRLHELDERFEHSIKVLTLLRGQHEDLLAQIHPLKLSVEKAHVFLREYKRKWAQTTDENRHFRIETKHLREKIEDFHRAKSMMNAKIDEQDIALNQLRKELNNELQTLAESRGLIEQLKRKLDETIHERDQVMKNLNIANKKIEKQENEISGLTNEIRSLEQTNQKYEKQVNTLHNHSQSLEHNERSYEEKIHECEILLTSLKEVNKTLQQQLEQKKHELNAALSEIQNLKYEQTSMASKLTKLEEVNQEYQRHISILERSVEEHKRLVRKREKELEQSKVHFENTMLNTSSLNNKCTKQEAEMSMLRIENASLNEEIRLMRDNIDRCQEEQRRLRKGCDDALNYIQDGIPDMCSNNHVLQTYAVQDITDNNSPCFPFDDQKKYKLMKAHSKQQQLLLNQLEAHVQFYESVFEKSGLPAIEYATAADALAALDQSHVSRDQL